HGTVDVRDRFALRRVEPLKIHSVGHGDRSKREAKKRMLCIGWTTLPVASRARKPREKPKHNFGGSVRAMRGRGERRFDKTREICESSVRDQDGDTMIVGQNSPLLVLDGAYFGHRSYHSRNGSAREAFVDL